MITASNYLINPGGHAAKLGGYTLSAIFESAVAANGDKPAVFDGARFRACAYQGRRTELINRGGLKFSAVEVESLLADLPQLNQFAVISRPDSQLGERSCLVATTRPDRTITLAEVVAHLAAKGLAKYKWPEELILVDELPSTPTGKIAHARLANLL